MFDPARDVISYCCTDDTMVPIRNERSWKAAIGEMYTKGLPRFVFTVKENGKRFSLPSFSQTHTKVKLGQTISSLYSTVVENSHRPLEKSPR